MISIKKKLNLVVFRICIGLMSIFLLLSIYLWFGARIEEPYFIPYRWKIGMPSEDSRPVSTELLLLRYFVNADDDSYVECIQFEEAPELKAYATRHTDVFYQMPLLSMNQEDTIYGNFKMKEVDVRFDYSTIVNPKEPLVLENATIKFSNGKTIHTKLGQITMYPKIDIATMEPMNQDLQFDSYLSVLKYLYQEGGL